MGNSKLVTASGRTSPRIWERKHYKTVLRLIAASPYHAVRRDEVEAALDDVNLGRLLGVLEELRASSQLIIITHQKRTMEIADALYGVTMRGDGVTEVISQRLRESETA